MSIEVANESGVEVDESALVSLARHVLDRMHIHPQAELSILLVDAESMEQLHIQWMDEPGPTDVLAFPMDELRPPRGDDDEPEPGLLGDVVICPQVAQMQAKTVGHATQDELNLLLTHGSCICSVTTTPSLRRNGDVRLAGRHARVLVGRAPTRRGGTR
jgi:probable rRNA maturation factor